MNPLLSSLHPYPFERLRLLFEDVTPAPGYTPISLGIGEPRHAAPQMLKEALASALDIGLSGYPATAGEPALRQACADWMQRRYGVTVDPATEVLSVNGTREALFAFAQTVLDPAKPGALLAFPNPFYQIYEGAALLGGVQPYYVPSDPARNFAIDWGGVPEDVWARVQMIYVCSPGNPTGAVMPLDEWKMLFELSDRYGFVIASDECYSEIYFQPEPPLGGLEAATRLGRDFRNLMMFTSLSKRSNVPGLRSGFVAGDAALIKPFLLYRTYHGSGMSPVVQTASIAAWGDEAHVQDNRRQYREKFAQVTPMLAEVMDVALPDASFYLWAGVPARFAHHTPGLSADVAFARELMAQYNVTVLPGSYLAREVNGMNPGAGRVRMALVAEPAECLEAARRIVDFCRQSG